MAYGRVELIKTRNFGFLGTEKDTWPGLHISQIVLACQQHKWVLNVCFLVCQLQDYFWKIWKINYWFARTESFGIRIVVTCDCYFFIYTLMQERIKAVRITRFPICSKDERYCWNEVAIKTELQWNLIVSVRIPEICKTIVFQNRASMDLLMDDVTTQSMHPIVQKLRL